MDAQLEAIKEAVEAGELDTARTLSDTYVADNASFYTGWEAKTVDGDMGLAANCDVYRATGRDDDLWATEAWLLHRFLPQNIGGAAIMEIRTPTNLAGALGVSARSKKVAK
jgi:hypothetical protein